MQGINQEEWRETAEKERQMGQGRQKEQEVTNIGDVVHECQQVAIILFFLDIRWHQYSSKADPVKGVRFGES
jgi:hypothetical protein